MKHILSLLFIASLLSPQAFSANLKPSDKNIRYIGRFTKDYQFAWTGSSIEIEFEASSISASFTCGKLSKGSVAMTAMLNGEEKVLFINPKEKDYLIADKLPKGKNKLTLFRRSEASYGNLQFEGFKSSGKIKLHKPQISKRRIHVIGDSITCGYGNGTLNLQEGCTVENENGYMSYAAIAARELQADIMMTCWSGKGMTRNGNANDPMTMPKLFDFILPKEQTGKFDHKNYIPDVFVINLGTNDMRKTHTTPLSKENYIRDYNQFIKKLRSYAPKSKIILCIGPMGFMPVKPWLSEIPKQHKNTSVLIFDAYKDASEKGGHFHPSIKKDKLMATQLQKAISKLTKWK